jgi:hypothetical protein
MQAGSEEDSGPNSSQIEASSQGLIDKDGSSESQVIGTDASALPGTLSSKYLRKQRRGGRVAYRPPQSSRSGRMIKMTSKIAQVFAVLQEVKNAMEGNSTDEMLNLAFAAAAEIAGSVGVPEAPVSYNDAVDDTKWRESMADEWKSLAKLKTFQFVDKLPPGKKAIRCKWVYKIKTNAASVITRYKSRLVIKGFEQQYGIDYTETFAPVAKIATARLLIALAAYYGWDIKQMDVKTAFLNPELYEDVYMQLPEGFDWLVDERNKGAKYIKLRKALYGLKQAPREWYQDIDTHLTNVLGFKRLNGDSNVYTKDGCILLLYVDDLLIFSKPTAASSVRQVKELLQQKYEMTDLGPANLFLGIQIDKLENGDIKIHQTKYIESILKRFNMDKSHGVSTPMLPNSKLSRCKESNQLLDSNEKLIYQSIVGSLMFAMVCTRPDLAFTLSRLSKFCSAPGNQQMQAARYALRYLRSTTTQGIVYKAQQPEPANIRLEGFSDSDFAADIDNRRSTSGYVYTLNGSAISWRSKQQDLVTLSTMEAEYVGMTEACKESIWL